MAAGAGAEGAAEGLAVGAAGAGGAAETLRTYLLATPSGAHNLLMKDEADTDSFLLAPTRADILIPLLDAGK